MKNTIVYDVFNGLYLNITNRCPCDCSFCVRRSAEGVSGNYLWLEHEPSMEEILSALGNTDMNRYEEAVFCGFGEPCERLEVLIQTAGYIKKNTKLPIRLNTNGLSDLINQKKTAPLLAPYIDRVSISLNAPDKETYNELCRPVFGADAFNAVIQFAKDCAALIPDVCFSVVDILNESQLTRCRELCAALNIRLRVRESITA